MLSGISIWQLLILLVIVVMVFGTKRLRGVGGDLGNALKDFRSAMKQGEKDEQGKAKADDAQAQSTESRVINQEPDDVAQHSEETASHDRTP